MPPALAEACGRVVRTAEAVWRRIAPADPAALADTLRRHALTVPADLGALR